MHWKMADDAAVSMCVSSWVVEAQLMVSDEEGEEPRWVGCDGCSKWRKVPAGFQFDYSKSFCCSMIESLTCDTPEEQWAEEEEFEIVDGGAPQR